MPRHPGNHLRATEHHPRLRPAEQLVAAGGDDVGAVGQRGGGVGLVGQQRVGRKQPAAEVDDQGHPLSAASARSSDTVTAEVNPSTRKLLWCTFSTHPVCGPIASA